MPDNLLMLSFSPRVWLCVLLLMVSGFAVQAESPTFTLAVGEIKPTDLEADECYFPVGFGTDTAVVSFPPQAMSCQRMLELRGATVRLQVVVEAK